MQKLKNPFVTILLLKSILLIVILSILLTSCSTCQSSKYRRKYFSEVQKLDLNNKINNI